MLLLKNILLILQKKEKQKIIQLILLDVIVSVLDIGFLIILLLLVDFYANPSRPLPYLIQFNNALKSQPIWLIGAFSLLFAFKNLFAFFVSKKQFHFIYGVASRISAERMSAFLDGDYLNYVNTDSSVHFRAINYDPIDFAHYVLRGVQQIIGQSILILFAIVPILFFKPILFSLLLLVLFPPVLLIAIVSRKRSHSMHDAAKFIHRKLIQHSSEAIAGYIESNIFQKKNFFLNRFVYYQEKQSKHLAQQQIIQVFPPRLIETFAVFGLFVLISINFFTKGKSIDLIIIGTFMAAAYKIIPGIVKILNSFSQIKAYSFSVSNLLNYRPHILAKKLSKNSSIKSIRFSNISFAYDNNPIIENLNIDLKNGDFTGITGISGKGKTTLLNLLLGFLEEDKGDILINDFVKTASERQALWGNITYVQQRAFLLNDTIIKNITLQENDYNTEKLEQVIQVTGVRQLVNGSSKDLDKIITEEGKNISGGQRQRIALARALYKEADLIILDEPFNELDKESENSIKDYLRQLSQSGKMIILITHDKESLSACNKIISLDEK